jgi:threonine synthase
MNEASIKYYSTNHSAPEVSFSEALLQGLAPDKGLYLPSFIPQFSTSELGRIRKLDYSSLAYTILQKFLAREIDRETLQKICESAYTFPVPLEKVYGNSYILRLDRGPTASFKDFAARMMARLMQHFLQKEGKRLLILTATSGDTGSAIANAFYGLENIDIVILFPENEVSPRQRKQMTTLQKNIKILSLIGKFDDCQALVKEAFVDPDLAKLNLSSANSINIGRLLPQSVFYFYAWAQLSESINQPVIFSVPSGNFGNLMGGIIAREMGLPVKRFIIATNANDEVPVYLKTSNYEVISPSRNCVSSAMNVGHPSNLARIITLYGGRMNEEGIILSAPHLDKLRKDFFAISITDEETRRAILDVFTHYNFLLEPHGAVAWEGLMKYTKSNPEESNILNIALETAHPAKFPEEIQYILQMDPVVPESMQGLEEKHEAYISLENNYAIFREFLLDHYNI